MELEPHIENVRLALLAAADAGGAEAHELAERLIAPLGSALQLALLNTLSVAADEITRDLAPGSVELRFRGGEPSFAVALPDHGEPTTAAPAATTAPSVAPLDADDGAMARINLRLPEQLKQRAEEAASKEGLSVNAWLVRAATNALAHDSPARSIPGPRGQHLTGWVQ